MFESKSPLDKAPKLQLRMYMGLNLVYNRLYRILALVLVHWGYIYREKEQEHPHYLRREKLESTPLES
jgi:hypothetical protein